MTYIQEPLPSLSLKELNFSTGHGLTDHLVRSGAPRLPEGYTYRLDIKHPTLSDGLPQRGPASVTARIGHLIADEWVEVVRFTEITRVSLDMASVAACKHAFETWRWGDEEPLKVHPTYPGCFTCDGGGCGDCA
jgi:hypothetical protein